MLKDENNLSPEDIKEVNIHSFAWVKTHELYGPADMVDAAFCIPYTVTQVLMGEPPGLGWYTDAKLESEEILNFSKKVKVTVDEEMDRAYFAEDRLSARVEITTNAGDTQPDTTSDQTTANADTKKDDKKGDEAPKNKKDEEKKGEKPDFKKFKKNEL